MIAKISDTDHSLRRTCLYRSYPTLQPNPIHILDSQPLHIGRSASCEISIHDETASRIHAVISQRATHYVIRDEKSTNGSLVNGVRTDEARLTDGDILFLGNTVFRVIEYDSETELEERISYICATLDPLTNSHRLNYFIDLMHREAERARRYGRDMTVFVCEPVQPDSQAHELPAQIIQAVVTRLRSTLRNDVCVSRLGPNNCIAILIPECSAAYARRTAERLADIIELKPFSLASGADESLQLIVCGAHTPLPPLTHAVDILQALLHKRAERSHEQKIELTSFEDLTSALADRRTDPDDMCPENNAGLTWIPAPSESPTAFDSDSVATQSPHT